MRNIRTTLLAAALFASATMAQATTIWTPILVQDAMCADVHRILDNMAPFTGGSTYINSGDTVWGDFMGFTKPYPRPLAYFYQWTESTDVPGMFYWVYVGCLQIPANSFGATCDVFYSDGTDLLIVADPPSSFHRVN